jgi:hypothetical protein
MPQRLEQFTATVTARLARVRGNMTEAEFQALIADVVRTAQKFGEVTAPPAPPNT